MQKLLIIGAKSSLGQELEKIFKADNEYKVIAWDREDINITSEKEVSKRVEVIKPNIIINTFQYRDIDQCEKDTKEYEAAKNINSLLPLYLAKAAKKNKAVLVQYSNENVFSGVPELPEPSGCTHSCATCALHDGYTPQVGFWEEDETSPVNKLGETLKLGEENVKNSLKKYYIIRYSRLFGNSSNSERDWLREMLEMGKGSKKMEFIDDETANLTYLPDLVRKTKEILDSQKPFGVYHVTNSGSCTWYEVAVELYNQAGAKTKVVPISGEELNRPAKRLFYGVLLNNKLNPMRNWRDAIKDYLKGNLK